jgi:hypothetical protein
MRIISITYKIFFGGLKLKTIKFLMTIMLIISTLISCTPSKEPTNSKANVSSAVNNTSNIQISKTFDIWKDAKNLSLEQQTANASANGETAYDDNSYVFSANGIHKYDKGSNKEVKLLNDTLTGLQYIDSIVYGSFLEDTAYIAVNTKSKNPEKYDVIARGVFTSVTDGKTAYCSFHDGSLKFIDLKTKKETVVMKETDHHAINFAILSEDKLYFSVISSAITSGLYCVNRDGTGLKLISSAVKTDWFIKQNNFIYYLDSDSRYIYRLNLDNNKKELFVKKECDFILSDGRNIYFKESNELGNGDNYKISAGTTNPIKINILDPTVGFFVPLNGGLFYRDYIDKENTFMKAVSLSDDTIKHFEIRLE